MYPQQKSNVSLTAEATPKRLLRRYSHLRVSQNGFNLEMQRTSQKHAGASTIFLNVYFYSLQYVQHKSTMSVPCD